MEDRKNILILFFIVFMTICCNGTQSLQNEKKVFAKKLSCGYKEYFVCYDKDTSQCSCIFSPVRSHGFRIQLYRSPNEKMFFNFIDEDENDTTAFGGFKKPREKIFRSPTSAEMIDEIKQCLSVASKKYNLNNLFRFSFRLSDWCDIAIQTSEILEKENKLNVIKHADINKALEKTSLKDSLVNIFGCYGKTIKEIACYELINSIRKENLKDYSPLYKDSHCPNEIVDVEVFVSFDDAH